MNAKINNTTQVEGSFQSFFENAPIGLYRTTCDGKIILANPALIQMLGYSSLEELTKRNLDREGFDNSNERRKFIDQIESTGVVKDFESVWISKHGSIVNVRENAFAVCDSKGKTVYYDGYVEDVTQRKRLEEDFKNEQLLLRTVIDNIPDLIYCKDTSYRKTLANKSDLRYMGANSENEILGMRDFDLYSKEQAEKSFVVDQLVLQTGQPIINREEYLIDEKGSKQWLLTSKLPMQDENGNIIGIVSIGRNITDRKLAEEENVVLVDALKSVDESVSITDMKDKLLFVNPALCNTYGYSVEELIGKDNSMLWSENNSKEVVEQILDSTFEGGWKGELLNKRKDGSEFPVSLSKSLIKNNSGEKIAVLTIAEDITERKQLELKRQVISEIERGITSTNNLDELFKLIHSSLSKVIYAENCFVALYDQTTGLFSFPFYIDKFDPTPAPSEMRKSCSAYVFKTGKSLFLTQELFDRLVEQNEVELVGTNSPSWIGVPLLSPTRTIGVLVLQHYEEENIYSEEDIKFLDTVGKQIAVIAERKMAEEALNHERNLLRTLIDGLPETMHVYIKDTKSRYLINNLAHLRSLGAARQEDVLGKSMFDFFPSEKAEKYFAEEQEIVRTRQPIVDMETLVYNKTREETRIHLITKIPICDSDGKVIMLVGMNLDITERKRAEEKIISASEELKELNSVKNKFFSIISHDLRSPFHSLLALSEILVNEADTLSIQEFREFSADIYKLIKQQYKLVESLLTWANLDSGKIAFNPVIINLSKVVDGIMNILSGNASPKEIKLHNKVAENIFINADENMLFSVLQNLIANAIKFTESGGEVTVTSKSGEEEFRQITVSDTGVGLKTEDIAKIFSLSMKHTTKGTDGEEGTGLGLNLCKQMVEKHNGKIWVNSIIGEGSEFNFTLPKGYHN